jgi:hypothetical protein
MDRRAGCGGTVACLHPHATDTRTARASDRAGTSNVSGGVATTQGDRARGDGHPRTHMLRLVTTKQRRQRRGTAHSRSQRQRRPSHLIATNATDLPPTAQAGASLRCRGTQRGASCSLAVAGLVCAACVSAVLLWAVTCTPASTHRTTRSTPRSATRGLPYLHLNGTPPWQLTASCERRACNSF